ncbi:ATP synthase F1 subunit gamma [Butyrivibrio sp. MC2013]|uniref:ATP synthase F1 subunit gamma n=1 Tax=Butyrivibrio sp. MC2013 TaxID=1280686 RepID=UPI0003FC171D|nr:ATP synthase F1 subunit gamma [Butyrivibrio sp. MC2013]
MSNTREIQERIKSVNDTLKITNAMYMISSNKLRKARKMLEDTEPYFYGIQRFINRIMRHLPEGSKDIFLSQNNKKKDEDKVRAYIIITDDKGLTGAYNTNVLKMAQEHMDKGGTHYKLYVIGEVGRQYFRRKNIPVEEAFQYTVQNPTMSRARWISSMVLQPYLAGEVDEISIIYTAMKNSIVCESRYERLLPLEMPKMNIDPRLLTGITAEQEEFQMIPSPEAVLDNIVPSLMTGYIYGALVEAFCSVQNSRMMAMDTANKNARDMIRELGIEYNRQRQARITQEITEVAAGARALRRAKELSQEKNSERW